MKALIAFLALSAAVIPTTTVDAQLTRTCARLANQTYLAAIDRGLSHEEADALAVAAFQQCERDAGRDPNNPGGYCDRVPRPDYCGPGDPGLPNGY